MDTVRVGILGSGGSRESTPMLPFGRPRRADRLHRCAAGSRGALAKDYGLAVTPTPRRCWQRRHRRRADRDAERSPL